MGRRKPAPGVASLKKYFELETLSGRNLLRVYDWDRPPLEIRKAPLSDFLASPPPLELGSWAARRSSLAMLDAAGMLSRYVKGGDEVDIAPLMNLLEDLVNSHPEILRPIVLPAVRALRSARERNDSDVAERLEKLLLLIAGSSPATLVAGVLVTGNWRFRSPAKKNRAGGRVKNKSYMVRAIQRAAADLRETFVLPATQRLSREGYKPMVDRLELVLNAIDSVIAAASRPAASRRREVEQ